jgi:adenylate cyclase
MDNKNTEHRKLAAIVFTDMVGFSALAQRNEKLALELLAEQQRLLRMQFSTFNGREVKVTGDGFLVEFPSALAATECAVTIQKSIAARNSTQPGERQFQVRIGIHVGDVVHREADMYGDGVNIASRIEPLARAGGICISDTVYAQVRNKLDVPLTKLDSPEMKNIEPPIGVYRIVLAWESPAPAPRPGRPEASGSKPVRLIAAAAAVSVLLVGGTWSLFRRPGPTSSNRSPEGAVVPVISEKSIVVLPFDNRSLQKADAFLGDEVAEDIRRDLHRIPGLVVAGRATSDALGAQGANRTDAGRTARAALVLNGAVTHAGSRLKITAELTRAATGETVWADSFDQPATGLEAIAPEIARRVAAQIQSPVAGTDDRAHAGQDPVNARSHRLYLEARSLQARGTEQPLRKSLALFDQAIAQDPKNARAYAGKAVSYRLLASVYAPPKEIMPLAKTAALQACNLDPNLPEAHTALGYVQLMYEWDPVAARASFRRAQQLDPHHADAFVGEGLLLSAYGNLDEALRMLQRVEEMDPLWPIVSNWIEWVQYLSHNYDGTIRQADRTLQLDPNFALSHGQKGLALLELGRTDEALKEFRQAVEIDPNYTCLGFLAYRLARTGKVEEARRLIARILDMQKKRYVCTYELASTYLALGQKEDAVRALNRSYDEGADCVIMTSVEDWNQPLHGDPRFAALLKRAHLPPPPRAHR